MMNTTRYASEPCSSIVNISNLNNCIETLKKVEAQPLLFPVITVKYSEVITKIKSCWKTFSIPLQAILYPFHEKLQHIQQTLEGIESKFSFWEHLFEEGERSLQAGLTPNLKRDIQKQLEQALDNMDILQQQHTSLSTDDQLQAISQALMATCCDTEKLTTLRSSVIQRSHMAFQEIISDFYLHYMRAIYPQDHSIPPIATWTNDVEDFSTYSARANRQNFNFDAAVVNFPKQYAKGGILAWACLGHEVAGHDILHQVPNLLEELTVVVENQLQEQDIPQDIIDYWTARIDESASDVLAILHMGPAAALAQIGFFRHLDPDHSRLTCTINEEDEHPANILRGFLAVKVVKILDLKNKASLLIQKELEKDTNNQCQIEMKKTSRFFNLKISQRSAEIVAQAIVNSPLKSLYHRSFASIRKWNEHDERSVCLFRKIFQDPLSIPSPQNSHATHIVAAAILESLEGTKNQRRLRVIFKKMSKLLQRRHLTNLFWRSCAC